MFCSGQFCSAAPSCNLHPPAAPACHSPKYEADSGKQHLHLLGKCARVLPQCKTCTWVSSGPMGCCWRWPTFFGQSARGGRLCANLSRDAHHQHQHRHLIGTRRRTGPSWPAALEWRVGLARGERPQPDSANLSLLSGGWQACAPQPAPRPHCQSGLRAWPRRRGQASP